MMRRADEIKDCSECGSPAELRFAGGFLCPDCYEDEPGVGGHIGTRRETAVESRRRLERMTENGGNPE